MIRISAGTAACMGLKKIKAPVLPTTAYLLLGQDCLMGCSFCPQSRRSPGKSDFLGRINWPSFSFPQLAAGLAEGERAGMGRVCLQGVRGEGGIAPLVDMAKRIKAVSSLPLSVSARVNEPREAALLMEAGAERISLALDAANPHIYRRAKGGSLEKGFRLLLECARLWPGRITTHIIIGLGETEEEALALMEALYGAGVSVALFAFTPIKGTPLAGHPPPEPPSYRRIQAASFLLQERAVAWSRFRFWDGRLVSFGLGKGELKGLLGGGRAFQTRGCPHCNRPYYNERPGGVLYNFSRFLTAEEEEEAFCCLWGPEGKGE